MRGGFALLGERGRERGRGIGWIRGIGGIRVIGGIRGIGYAV